MRFAWTAAIALAGLVAAALVCILAAAAWLVATPDGLRWALARAVDASEGRLAIEDARGTLASRVRLGRLAWKGDGFEVASSDVAARLDPFALLAGTLRIEEVHGASLRIILQEKAQPTVAPSAPIRLPFALELPEVRLDSVSIRSGPRAYAAEKIRGSTRLGANGIESLKLRAPQIDLALLDPALPHTRLDISLAGASAAGSLLSGTLSASNAAAGTWDRGRLPLESLSARFALKGPEVVLERIRANAAGGIATGKGLLRSGRARLQIELSGVNLRAAQSTLPQTRVSGPMNLDLSAAQQSLNGALVDAASRLSAKFSARVEGKRLSDARLSAQLGSNRLSASGSFGAPGDSLAWSLDAPSLPIEGFSGRLRASGTAGGSWGEPHLSFSARAAPALIAGRVHADELKARFEGTLRSHRLSLRLSAKGRDLDLSARLEGGWSGEAGWKGRLLELANRGRYPLQLSGTAPLEASAKAVHAGPLHARLGEGRFEVSALDWQPGRLSTRGEFSALPAAWLLSLAGVGEELRSTLLLEGAWSLDSTPLLSGRVTVRRSSGDLTVLQPAPLDAGVRQALLEARLDAGKVHAELTMDSRVASLSAHAEAGGFERDSPLELSAALKIADIRVLAASLPAVLRVGGHAEMSLEGRGTLGEPQLRGRLSADALSVHLPPYGVYLGEGSLRAALEGDALRIDELVLHGGKGRFVASGRVPLLAGAESAKLKWKAEKLRLLSRPDMRLVASGEGSAGLEGGRVQLEGRLRVDSGRLERGLQRLPGLSGDIVVVGASPGPVPAKRTPIPLDLEVLVELGEHFHVRESGFDGLLKGQVHVSSSASGELRGELRAFGRIEAANATYRAYGQSLTVDPGIVIFDGPIGNPALQITAMRRNQQVEAGIRITGTLEQPHVELVSEPPVSESAALSWLVLGRAPAEATGADLGVLQAAASALLGKGDSVPITTRVAHAVGLDEISLRGSGELSSQVVAFGKRLSDRLYFTYEQGVGPVAQNLVKLDLSLTDRISLRAQTGNLTSGAGVYYRYSWD
jgi:translocation and assembly module TamB